MTPLLGLGYQTTPLLTQGWSVYQTTPLSLTLGSSGFRTTSLLLLGWSGYQTTSLLLLEWSWYQTHPLLLLGLSAHHDSLMRLGWTRYQTTPLLTISCIFIVCHWLYMYIESLMGLYEVLLSPKSVYFICCFFLCRNDTGRLFDQIAADVFLDIWRRWNCHYFRMSYEIAKVESILSIKRSRSWSDWSDLVPGWQWQTLSVHLCE